MSVDNRHSPYLTSALYNMQMIVDDAVKELRNIQFEAMVCTGVSGLLVAPLLAYKMGKTLAIVRKEKDTDNHADTRIESGMEVGDRWIFVDDLIASGATIIRVKELMAYAGWPPMVGHYTYNSPHFTPGSW